MTAAPRDDTPRRNSPREVLITVGALTAALAFLALVNFQRITRSNYVTRTPTWSVDEPAEDPRSVTGYVRESRRHVVPGHHRASYEWIIQTQLALAGQAEPHRIAHENFPNGRLSLSTSPYRWWLTACARMDSWLTGRSLPLAVERAALYADPLLHALLLISITLAVHARVGAIAAATIAVAGATLFPLAGAFRAGAPDEHSLAWSAGGWGLLALVLAHTSMRPGRWLVVSALAGALTLWTDHFTGEQLLAGLLLGGVLAATSGRFARRPGRQIPWRLWGMTGTILLLAAYLLEYPGAVPGWTVATIHPLHAVAWAGCGELLHQLTAATVAARPRASPRTWLEGAVAVAAGAVLPILRLFPDNGSFLPTDPAALELVNLENGVQTPHLAAWVATNDRLIALLATVLPLVAAGLAACLLFARRPAGSDRHAVLGLALGPVLVSAIIACWQVRMWSAVDVMILSLLAALMWVVEAEASLTWRWMVRSSVLAIAILGLALLPPTEGNRGTDPLDEYELQSVVERDLAYWLRLRAAGETPVVFTTPALTEALSYFGGVRGVVSQSPENPDGLAAAMRLASASTWPEAFALVDSRNISHVILPSWDLSLGRLTQMGRQLPPDAPIPRNTLYALLSSWEMPPWLRLQTYHAPRDAGPHSVDATVFVRDADQDEILAACRLADYLVEMGRLEQTAAVEEKLRLYPRSLPALGALAQLHLGTGNTEEYRTALAALQSHLGRRAGRTLPLDRRISLAALLVQAEQRDAARELLQAGETELKPAALHRLTTAQLVRLLAMYKLLGLNLPDPTLRPLALSLLPPMLREQLTKGATP